MLVPEELHPGDVLLYGPTDLFGLLICVKTWTMLSHVEIYVGRGQVIAARPEGVNIYSERIDESLKYVRRPIMQTGTFDKEAAYKSVMQMIGSPYETAGLFSFYMPWMNRHRATRICSSVVTVFLRGGGCEPFNPELDADDVSPAQLWQSGRLETVWERDKI